MRYSDYVKFAPVSLTYEEWANLETEMKKELQVMAEADEAVVNMLMYTNLPQELHNEIAYNLEKMRKEFDKLENKYYDLKINGGNKMKNTYNGWRNRSTWNVSLWINNDYGLYSSMVEFMKNYKGRKPYKDYIEYMGMEYDTTGDGVRWLSNRLDYRALNEMMNDWR